MRLLETVVAGGVVVIWADGLSDSPVGDGEIGVQLSRATKRTRGFIVIERVNETQSLIEKPLRFRILSGNGMVSIPETGHEGDGPFVRRVRRMFLGPKRKTH